MAEQTAANQAKEMQARTAKPGGASSDAPKKDAAGNLVGANIAADGKPIPQVAAQEPPGLVQSGLVGGVGISGSGQDQDAAEVQSRGEEENERRADELKEKEEEAKKQEEEAAKAAKGEKPKK